MRKENIPGFKMMFSVFLEKREGSGRYGRRNGSQRWHLQVLCALTSQSRVALFVNMSSIHLCIFCSFVEVKDGGRVSSLYCFVCFVLFFSKLPFENVKCVLSELRTKGFYS